MVYEAWEPINEPSENELKNISRTERAEYMATVDDVDIRLIIRTDNKYVTVLSLSRAKPCRSDETLR